MSVFNESGNVLKKEQLMELRLISKKYISRVRVISLEIELTTDGVQVHKWLA